MSFELGDFEDFDLDDSIKLPLDPPERYEPEDPTTCANCGSRENIALTPSHTSYWQPPPTRYDRALEEIPLSPNRPTPLCPGCADEHNEYWDEMWKEYYSSR